MQYSACSRGGRDLSGYDLKKRADYSLTFSSRALQPVRSTRSCDDWKGLASSLHASRQRTSFGAGASTGSPTQGWRGR